MNAFNSVIKQTFENNTVVEEPKRFIITDEQKKIIDQVVLDSMVGNTALNQVISNSTQKDTNLTLSLEKGQKLKNEKLSNRNMIHPDFLDKNMTHDHHFLHQKEGIRNIPLKDHNASQESSSRQNTKDSLSNAVVSQNHTQLKEQYVSSWGKVKEEHKSDEQK